METKRILVTGGAGFMGSWLVDELVRAGHDVTSVDNLFGGWMRNVNSDCNFVRADLRRRSEIGGLLKRVQVVFHLAAYAAEGQSFFSPIGINEINLVPMNNLLVEAVNNHIDRFVFTSSMAVYGAQKPPFSEEMPKMPEDPYGAAKTYCETMLEIFSRTFGLEHVILRPHNVYGPRQNTADPYRNVLGIWINRILREKRPVIYGDGEQTRAFSYIEDVTPAMIAAGNSPKARDQVINIGSDQVVSVNRACQILLKEMKTQLAPVHEKERPGEVKHAYCTVKKSIDLLGYQTKHSLMEGVGKMVEWARKLGPQDPTYTLPLEITENAPRMWAEKLM